MAVLFMKNSPLICDLLLLRDLLKLVISYFKRLSNIKAIFITITLKSSLLLLPLYR